MDQQTLAKFLDFARHDAQTMEKDIRDLCANVKKYNFHSVFVNPYWIKLARSLIGNSGTVGTVISFPLGQETKETKITSAMKAIDQGANEIDVSMNVGLFKQGIDSKVLAEMKDLIMEVRKLKKFTLVKFIIETGLLNSSEIKRASELVLKSGADFIKTCSGWGPRGASLEDIRIIKSAVGEKIKIKASGGIDTFKEAVDFINAGADRIGTSKAIEILNDLK